jgi:hypothetical protein
MALHRAEAKGFSNLCGRRLFQVADFTNHLSVLVMRTLCSTSAMLRSAGDMRLLDGRLESTVVMVAVMLDWHTFTYRGTLLRRYLRCGKWGL